MASAPRLYAFAFKMNYYNTSPGLFKQKALPFSLELDLTVPQLVKYVFVDEDVDFYLNCKNNKSYFVGTYAPPPPALPKRRARNKHF